MREIAELVSVLACGLVAGAAVYISLVEYPARMECGVETAATEFPPSCRRANIMHATFAGVGLLTSLAAWFASPTLDKRSAQTTELLARWARLHAFRSVVSVEALLLLVYLSVFGDLSERTQVSTTGPR